MDCTLNSFAIINDESNQTERTDKKIDNTAQTASYAHIIHKYLSKLCVWADTFPHQTSSKNKC